MKRAILALSLVTLTPFAVHAEDESGLQLSAGTMQFGGVAGFQYEVVFPENFDSENGYLLELSPSFSYFVMDNLSLQVSLKMVFPEGYLEEGTSTVFSGALGVRYYISNLGYIVPYAGLDIGFGVVLPTGGGNLQSMVFGLPGGVLFPLNRHAAVDVGLRLLYNLSLDEGGVSRLTIPVAYFGMQAFF